VKQTDVRRLDNLISRLEGLVVEPRQLLVMEREITLNPDEAYDLSRKTLAPIGESESQVAIRITQVRVPEALPAARVDPRVEVLGQPVLGGSAVIDIEIEKPPSPPPPAPPCALCESRRWLARGSAEGPAYPCPACSATVPSLPAPEPQPQTGLARAWDRGHRAIGDWNR